MQPVIEVPVKATRMYASRYEAISLLKRMARKYPSGFPYSSLVLVWLVCCIGQLWTDSGKKVMPVSYSEFFGVVFDWHALSAITLWFFLISLAIMPFTLLFKHQLNALLFAHTIKLPQWNEILQLTDKKRKLLVRLDPYSKAKPPMEVFESKLTDLRDYYLHHIPVTKEKDIIAFPIGVIFVVYFIAAHLVITGHVLRWFLSTTTFMAEGIVFFVVAILCFNGYGRVRWGVFYRMALDELVKEYGIELQEERRAK